MKARLTRVTDWDETDSLKRPDGRLEATGGCGWRRLGLLAGGGSADVAGWVDDFNILIWSNLTSYAEGVEERKYDNAGRFLEE